MIRISAGFLLHDLVSPIYLYTFFQLQIRLVKGIPIHHNIQRYKQQNLSWYTIYII